MKKLLLLATFALSMSLLACDGKAKTPEDAFEKYMDALVNMDAKAIVDMTDLKDSKREKAKRKVENTFDMIKAVNGKIEILEVEPPKVVKENEKVRFKAKIKISGELAGKEINEEKNIRVVMIRVGEEWMSRDII